MSAAPPIDVPLAHRYFAAAAFNQCWDLIDRNDRAPEQNEQMLLLSLASLWHWTQRADCTAQNRSIGYWQVSRVYSLLGQGDNARRYGELCLNVSGGEPPFYLGYAYEALARAAMVAGDRVAMTGHLEDARKHAAAVADADSRAALEKDLETIR